MTTEFKRLSRTWQCLGEEDPLWAVLSHSDKRGGGWDAKEFFQTGEQTVDRLHRLLRDRARTPDQFEHVLDFGCGVGRLSRAWGSRARRVTGVDISAPMIERGRTFLGDISNVELVVNEREDLRQWPDETFDLVFSYICLQHMPWPLAAGYLAEFARVCRAGGWVAFQMPSQLTESRWGPRLRQRLMSCLPRGWAERYRKWRRVSSVAFEMHFVRPEILESTAATSGLKLLHREPDRASGPGTDGWFYVFQKPKGSNVGRPGTLGRAGAT